MEQVGQVVALDGDLATVVVRRHDVCGKCGGCGAMLSGGGENYVKARNMAGAHVGQSVKVVTDTGKVLKASFVAYIIPILALLAGIWLGQQFGAALGLFAREELVGLAFGIAFLLLSYLAVRGYDRRVAGEGPRVAVVKILEENVEVPEDEQC
jgi:sigma-E factor negative regulatory protein RseC